MTKRDTLSTTFIAMGVFCLVETVLLLSMHFPRLLLPTEVQTGTLYGPVEPAYLAEAERRRALAVALAVGVLWRITAAGFLLATNNRLAELLARDPQSEKEQQTWSEAALHAGLVIVGFVALLAAARLCVSAIHVAMLSGLNVGRTGRAPGLLQSVVQISVLTAVGLYLFLDGRHVRRTIFRRLHRATSGSSSGVDHGR